MKESDINVFIDSAKNYFKFQLQENVEVGIPYIKLPNSLTLEYTGIIGISGNHKGSVCITSPKSMLEKIAIEIFKEVDPGDDILQDIIGEMANVFSGNARKKLGSNFYISTPIVIKGKLDNIEFIKMKSKSYIIPINWKEFKFFILVGIE